MSAPTIEIKKVVVHPLVLLSVVDHFNRIRNQRRVVGVLLGSWRQGILDVANCFAGKLAQRQRITAAAQPGPSPLGALVPAV